MGRLKHLGNKCRLREHPLPDWERYYEGYERIFGDTDRGTDNIKHIRHKVSESK